MEGEVNQDQHLLTLWLLALNVFQLVVQSATLMAML